MPKTIQDATTFPLLSAIALIASADYGWGAEQIDQKGAEQLGTHVETLGVGGTEIRKR